ncbi:DUF6249 domain-containing protein [Pedobacter chitinilyticus]|uniref:DUF6249 domain-containing protein n=1 Tax=Pedobacter chitinilyticus TaxID=2233776 RepID=A0A443Z281_9SPHI|nr:DUF6249 domain-containing protein [Pedobacter chitinilyticus]RWU10643.1 hypothetical protein DPV69_04705 [Pedobacter chitinilyticus]
MESTSAALFISICLVIFGISYYYFTTRHKERMEIIERGLDPHHFKGQSEFSSWLLILGIVSIGIALGIATGTWLSLIFPQQKIAIFCFCIFLGLGLALISCGALLKNMRKKD